MIDNEEDESVQPSKSLLTAEPRHALPKTSTKFVFLGDPGCGKTSIIKKSTINLFNEHEVPSNGIDFKPVGTLVNGEEHKLMLWDTPGKDRLGSRLNDDFFRNTDCYVIVYDLTNGVSCHNVKRWLKRIDALPTPNGSPKAHRLLVGNKFDLMTTRAMETELLMQLVEQVDDYVETSAYDGQNLDKLLKRMTIIATERRGQKKLKKKQKT